jgi:hypothetical protein
VATKAATIAKAIPPMRSMLSDIVVSPAGKLAVFDLLQNRRIRFANKVKKTATKWTNFAVD